MSSDRERRIGWISRLARRAGLIVSIRLTLWFSFFLILVALGTYWISYALVLGAMEDEWDVSVVDVREKAEPSHGGKSYEILVEEESGTMSLPAAMREDLDEEFRRTFFLLVVPLVVLAIFGGLLLTWWVTWPARRFAELAHRVVSTGELDERIPLGAHRGELTPVAFLFNRMLDRIESLVASIHDSLDHVAHDLRTPMTRLRAVAERALQRPDDAAACSEAIADCMEESERILAMLNNLMDVAEAQTGAMRLDRSDISLRELIAGVADLYEFVAEERKSRILLEEGERDLRILADADRLKQALANLVDNSLKYGGEDNEVRIALREEAGSAILSVTDRGPGIRDEDLPLIWDRLYRGDLSRSERGLGLGLSYARAIVEAHGGSVDVSTEMGKGSTFVFRLPLDRADPVTA
jgi:signal transduction histidine kinase